MSRPPLDMASTRLLALTCAVLLGACESGSGGADTDSETDSETEGSTDPTDPTADPSNGTSGETSDADTGATSGDPTSADGSSSGDPTDSAGPTGDPTDSGDPTGDTGDPGAPQIPKLQGECPEFTLGTEGNPAQLTFPVGTGSRDALVWFDPAQGGGGPLVFFFHGGGGEAEQAESSVTNAAIDQVVADGGMVIAPIADPAANLSWFLASGSSQNDVIMQDSMVACADAGPGIDRERIHAIGFSAGGIHAAMVAILRSSYMASTVTYSGGVYNGVTPDNAEATASALAFHGGNADNVGGLPFDAASELYAEQLRERDGYALVCNHGTGHGYPENDANWQRSDAYNFLVDHPWGVDPKPYEGGGTPEWVPPYCSDQG